MTGRFDPFRGLDVLIDRENWRLHRPWLILCVLATLAAAGAFYAEGRSSETWPGGSSVSGFTFGILGGLICLFEMLLWWRKQVRVLHVGRVQVWLRAHIWLGLLSVPLLVLHSGFRFGGTLSMMLMILFLIVIASGVWGLVMQQVFPRLLLEGVPGETSFAQCELVASRLSRKAREAMDASCGSQLVAEAEAKEPGAAPAGEAKRAPPRGRGATRAMAPAGPVAGSEPLLQFFRDHVVAFLEGDGTGPLRIRTRAVTLFQGLRKRVPAEVQPAIDEVERLCEQRRQLRLQARLHFWLHNWLWLHLPLAVAMIVLMVMHVVAALKYW